MKAGGLPLPDFHRFLKSQPFIPTSLGQQSPQGGGGWAVGPGPLGEALASPLGPSAPPLVWREDDNWGSFIPGEADLIGNAANVC